MNKAYWREASSLCNFLLSQWWKPLSRPRLLILWLGNKKKKLDQEYLRCWSFPTSHIFTPLAPIDFYLPVPHLCSSGVREHISGRGKSAALEVYCCTPCGIYAHLRLETAQHVWHLTGGQIPLSKVSCLALICTRLLLPRRISLLGGKHSYIHLLFWCL